jgi:hypothetical protein
MTKFDIDEPLLATPDMESEASAACSKWAASWTAKSL